MFRLWINSWSIQWWKLTNQILTIIDSAKEIHFTALRIGSMQVGRIYNAAIAHMMMTATNGKEENHFFLFLFSHTKMMKMWVNVVGSKSYPWTKIEPSSLQWRFWQEDSMLLSPRCSIMPWYIQTPGRPISEKSEKMGKISKLKLCEILFFN